ncbi:MAG: phytoene desaturase [Bacteroidetes bacterium]|nr:phytoene desaturase [Bacteroidota bacterium]
MRSVSVIGGGISGLSAACFLAKDGLDVTIYEKNDTIGGRCRVFQEKGFTFDMGPSWYWMPDVFEGFFTHFNKTAADYYHLIQLDPGFQIILGKDDILLVPAEMEELRQVFEAREKGSAARLDKFLSEAAYKYRLSMTELVKTPAYSWLEFAKAPVFRSMFKMNLFSSVRTYVRSYFRDPGLVALLEFPVLFLGAMPNRIPALYTLMNHAALTQGTFYPMGGMGRIIDAMQHLALSLGVKIQTAAAVQKLNISNGHADSVTINGHTIKADAVVAAADYHHVEQQLLPAAYRNYTEEYWDKKTLAPSCLIYYIGLNKKLSKLQHHNLFFDTDFEQHANEIYTHPRWPQDPLFYVCCPSKTDPSVAPSGNENLFILIPIAPALNDEATLRDVYFNKIITKLETFCGESFKENIVVNKSYGISNFMSDYNAYKGNAYGLANTLRQTAVLKPAMRNKKVNNLFYAGQLTVPGPGLPPSLISGEIVAGQVLKQLKKLKYESAF